MALGALLAVAAPVAPAAAKSPKQQPKLSVMTRNIYLGGDISKPIGTFTPAQFAAANQEVWNTVVKTDFPARAKLLAKEIAQTRPDLVGLQEVALWRTGPANDPAPSTAVVYDYLALLRAEIRKRGLKYKVGSLQNEADVEGQTQTNGDVRLTMRDVVLVKRRKGLKITGKGGANYAAGLTVPVPTATGSVNVKRGYTYVDGRVGSRKFRFLDTHFEAFLGAIRQAQAAELVAAGGPTATTRALIVVGDLNSDPKGDPQGKGDPVPYNTLIGSGLADAWTRANPRNPGYSCCLTKDDLSDAPPFPADHRIDHVLTSKSVKAVRAKVIGTARGNRTKSGLWPSDHAGVVATLRLAKK